MGKCNLGNATRAGKLRRHAPGGAGRTPRRPTDQAIEALLRAGVYLAFTTSLKKSATLLIGRFSSLHYGW